jgi:hypothetical protein
VSRPGERLPSGMKYIDRDLAIAELYSGGLIHRNADRLPIQNELSRRAAEAFRHQTVLRLCYETAVTAIKVEQRHRNCESRAGAGGWRRTRRDWAVVDELVDQAVDELPAPVRTDREQCVDAMDIVTARPCGVPYLPISTSLGAMGYRFHCRPAAPGASGLVAADGPVTAATQTASALMSPSGTMRRTSGSRPRWLPAGRWSVTQPHAPYWALVDVEGNEVCVGTWQDRD